MDLQDFAVRYTAAWCSGQPERVASFFTPNGSLQINTAAPAQGREAIRDAAASFMETFPDLRVVLDSLETEREHPLYRWTLTGTSNGKFVRISGYEEWTFGTDGLIEQSLGHFDAADYERQLS